MRFLPWCAALAIGSMGTACQEESVQDDDSTPVADDDSTPVADDDSTPVADDDSTPVADDDSTPVADDDSEAPVPTTLVINEFMADNEIAAMDEAGHAGDWIELYNHGGEDIPLAGFSITDNLANPTLHLFTGDLLLPAHGFLLLWADEDPASGPSHLAFGLNNDGESLGIYDPSGDAIDLLNFGPQVEDVAASRLPDGGDAWELQWHGTPGATNTPDVEEEIDILGPGQLWSFFDEEDVGDPDWMAVDYDDSHWAVGFAPLGYGDVHIMAPLEYGPNANAKYMTAWVRMDFVYTSPGDLVDLRMDILCDDGARVFLNGEELFRHNLPAGDLTADTPALSSVGGAGETTFLPYPLDPSLLVEGTNTLAAEIHQFEPSSSDLGFDLGVVGVMLVPWEE